LSATEQGGDWNVFVVGPECPKSKIPGLVGGGAALVSTGHQSDKQYGLDNKNKQTVGKTKLNSILVAYGRDIVYVNVRLGWEEWLTARSENLLLALRIHSS
jgi:hypothetical protein